MTEALKLKLRRATSSQWDVANPILAEGEIGFVLDTTHFKIGDGLSRWDSLSYATSIDKLYSSNAPSPGMFPQMLEGGGRFTDTIDGGDANGIVVYPSLLPVAPTTPGNWTPGSTNFVFGGAQAVSTNFVF